jgi:hypothetical protein
MTKPPTPPAGTRSALLARACCLTDNGTDNIVPIKGTGAFYSGTKWTTDAGSLLLQTTANWHDWLPLLLAAVCSAPGFLDYLTIHRLPVRAILADCTKAKVWWANNNLVKQAIMNTINTAEQEAIAEHAAAKGIDWHNITSEDILLHKQHVKGTGFDCLNTFVDLMLCRILRTSHNKVLKSVNMIVKLAKQFWLMGTNLTKEDLTKLLIIHLLDKLMSLVKALLVNMLTEGKDYSLWTVRNRIDLECTTINAEHAKQVNAVQALRGGPSLGRGGSHGSHKHYNNNVCINCSKIGHQAKNCPQPETKATKDFFAQLAKRAGRRGGAPSCTVSANTATTLTTAGAALLPKHFNASVEFELAEGTAVQALEQFFALKTEIAANVPEVEQVKLVPATNHTSMGAMSWRMPKLSLSMNKHIAAHAGQHNQWILNLGATTHCTPKLANLTNHCKVELIAI